MVKKTYIDLAGKPFDMVLEEVDISKWNVLYHMTPIVNIPSIKKEGLLTKKPSYKSLVKTDLLFFSYPVDGNTSDLFRFDEDHHAIIMIDTKKLIENGIKFYIDPFSKEDRSSKRNHLCTNSNIPEFYFKEIVKFK